MCRNICYRIFINFFVIKPISRYSRFNVHYCLDSRTSLPDGGGRGAYRIEMQALSTGPEVRGTYARPTFNTYTRTYIYVYLILPIHINVHTCAARVRNVGTARILYAAAGTACSGNDGGVPG